MGGRIVRTKTLVLTQISARNASAGEPPFASFACLRLSENRRLIEEANLSQRRKGAAIYFSMTINARLNSRSRCATKKMRFPCNDRVMTGTKDQTPGYICPGYDLSVPSR